MATSEQRLKVCRFLQTHSGHSLALLFPCLYDPGFPCIWENLAFVNSSLRVSTMTSLKDCLLAFVFHSTWSYFSKELQSATPLEIKSRAWEALAISVLIKETEVRLRGRQIWVRGQLRFFSSVSSAFLTLPFTCTLHFCLRSTFTKIMFFEWGRSCPHLANGKDHLGGRHSAPGPNTCNTWKSSIFVLFCAVLD